MYASGSDRPGFYRWGDGGVVNSGGQVGRSTRVVNSGGQLWWSTRAAKSGGRLGHSYRSDPLLTAELNPRVDHPLRRGSYSIWQIWPLGSQTAPRPPESDSSRRGITKDGIFVEIRARRAVFRGSFTKIHGFSGESHGTQPSWLGFRRKSHLW